MSVIPCDSCQRLAAENKLLKQLIGSLMEMLAINRVVVTVDKTAAVHYLPTESGAFEVTSD